MSPLNRSQFATSLIQSSDPNEAIDGAIAEIQSQLRGEPDLTFVFISQFDPDQVSEIHRQLRQSLRSRVLLGCTAESIVGTNSEIEMEPGVSLWSASLPDTSIHPFHLTFENTPDGGTILGWPDAIDEWPDAASMILLPEPFSFPTDYLLERLKEDRPKVRIIGGVASGGATEGQNRLLFGDELHSTGCVGLMMDGKVTFNTIVSQGCRPIGKPMVITKAERNIIHELGGRPAYDQLSELYESLPNREKELVQRQLHLGIVSSEYRDHFEFGDFLIRNVLGVDPNEKVIAIGNYVRVGQTVQFHVRDESSADTDLTQRLTTDKSASGEALAALMFTCNGRGTRMFSVVNHDANAVHQCHGSIPTAGFFAQGEIGPIADENFVHGFTASIAIFREALDD